MGRLGVPADGTAGCVSVSIHLRVVGMKILWRCFLWRCLLATILLALPIVAAKAQEETPGPPDEPAATQEEEAVPEEAVPEEAASEEAGPEDEEAVSEDAVPENAADEPLPEEYSCMFCHGPEGTLSGDEETTYRTGPPAA